MQKSKNAINVEAVHTHTHTHTHTPYIYIINKEGKNNLEKTIKIENKDKTKAYGEII